MSGLFKPFGLQPRNTMLDSIREENVRSHQSTSTTSVRSYNNVSTVSRTFGLGSENIRSISTQNSRLNQDVRNNRSSFVPTSFGLQMRSLSTLRGIPLNDNSRLNQEPNIRNYRNTNEHFQTSNSSRIFGPPFRDTTLSNSLQVQEKGNNGVDTGGFRIPSIPRMIRGRNPITSSRIFSHHNIEKCNNLSNINGFDVSHISRRDMDTMSDSRLGLMRNGWMDKQSISGSMYSTSSVKAQAMNLLENLHYSILNMGPYLSVEAVTMEIEKAKQGLDNISEMSFTHSIREADAMSITSQTSKYNCPENDRRTKNIINGECLNLKSGKEILKSLALSKTQWKNKMILNETKKRSTHDVSKQNLDFDDFDEEESCLVFKKPKSFTTQKKNSKSLKIITPPVKKPVTSKATSKIINLKQWYPIAVGNDLALCGVDEHGVSARTDAMKRRISNRKVELIDGFICNLIGSPSSMASLLPKNIASSIRNGLAFHWKVLQKKLQHYQTVAEKKQKKSTSPAKKASPKKLQTPQTVITKTATETDSAQKSPRKEVKKRKSPPVKSSSVKKTKSPGRTENKKPPVSRVVSSPKKGGNGVRTRSGRAIKPPTMFWMVSGNNEIPAADLSFLSEYLTETPVVQKTKTRKPIRPEPKPGPKPANEPEIVESHVVNSTADVDESCKRRRAVLRSRNKGEQSKKNKEGERDKTEEASEVVKVVSSTEEKTRGNRGKRKRDPKAETESTQRKKSKIDSMEELQVESTVADTKVTTTNRKQKTTQNTKKANSPAKPKPKNRPQKKEETKSKKTAKGASANTTETKFGGTEEVEEDFELQLDDIEIPQFGNLSGNPQLSRSQLRLVSAETPPLKYFNSNLKVFTSTTPMRSPDWVISQRTESEVKQFQKRRAEAFKKRVEVRKTESKKTLVREKTQSRDLKKVLEWVAEKTVQSPQWNSEVLQYVLPSRRQLEQQEQEEEEEEDEDDNAFA